MEFKAQLTSELSLWQLSPLEAREQIAALLFLADESWMMINRYLPTATIYALRQAGEFVGSIAVKAQDEITLEIMNIAVIPTHQRHGFGRQLINFVEHDARQQGYRHLLVGTGDGSVQNIAFYIRIGFRFAEIKTNFFEQYEQPIIENGIQLRDMIVLAKELFI